MNPLAVALQGIGFAATLVAMQGFGPADVAVVEPAKYYASVDSMQALHRQRLGEDEVILAVIMQFVLET